MNESASNPSSDERLILHVDMDAFFAAIEQLDRPELRGLPVIVGSAPDARGVVSTCSYEARRFGVHSAMPSRTAYKLCPEGIFVPVRGERYREVSHQVRAVFASFTPRVQPLSIDEAFLDMTGARRGAESPAAVGRAVKDAVRAATGLTCSVGVAPNMFLAKLASDMDKPDGLTVVPRDPAAIAAWLAPLPVRRVWGVGPKMAERLAAAGLHRVADLQACPADRLTRAVGEREAERLKRLALGRDERDLELDAPVKSISHEHTFDEDCRDWQTVRATLVHLAERVGLRLRQQDKIAATAQLKLRWSDFETLSRQTPLTPPGDSERALVAAGIELLDRVGQRRAVRLVGFGVANLHERGEVFVQPDLFAAADPEAADPERERQLDAAVDAIRERFGRDSIRRRP